MADYIVPPVPPHGRSILIVCEGQEEEKYIRKLVELSVFDPIYHIDTVNAEGNGNLGTFYTTYYQQGDYDLILIFCDTDQSPYTQYEEVIRASIVEFTGSEEAADSVIIFGNPCTMQVVISHFGRYLLKTSAKKGNREIIEEATGIEHYKAKDRQVDAMMELLSRNNYHIMKKNIESLSSDYHERNSTNIGGFLDCLEKHDTTWIDRINELLEGEY